MSAQTLNIVASLSVRGRSKRTRLSALRVSSLALSVTLAAVSVTPWVAAAQGGSGGATVHALQMADCGGFTAEDATRLLGTPAAQLERKTQSIGPTSWICTFAAQDGKGVSFSVSVSKSTREAAEDMERLRANLELAAETPAFKDRLPAGAYSEIGGPDLGDETVWTDINGTLTVRKGNIVLQVLMPSGKRDQIRVSQAFLKKL